MSNFYFANKQLAKANRGTQFEKQKFETFV